MSSKRSIFFDAWQACLRAHYVHVIRANDTVTEPTLRAVLLQSGLSEDDLHALYEEALALGPLTPDDEIMLEPGYPPVADIEPDSEEIYAEETPEMLEPALDEPDRSEDLQDEGEPHDDTDQPPPPSQQLSLF